MLPHKTELNNTCLKVYIRCATAGGLIFGDPRGECISIDHPTVKPSDIRAVEVLSKTASRCALALLDVFFSKESLVRSLATKKDGKDLLDPDIIEGICCKINIVHCLNTFITIAVMYYIQCTSITSIHVTPRADPEGG